MGNAEETVRVIMETVPQLMRTIRGEMRSAAESSLTVPQFRILNKIAKGHCSNRELSEWMGVTAPTMSRMIAALCRKKMLKVHVDPKDRRVQRIELTPAGTKIVNRIRTSVRSRLAARIEGLSAGDSKDLQRLLPLLRDQLLGEQG